MPVLEGGGGGGDDGSGGGGSGTLDLGMLLAPALANASPADLARLRRNPRFTLLQALMARGLSLPGMRPSPDAPAPAPTPGWGPNEPDDPEFKRWAHTPHAPGVPAGPGPGGGGGAVLGFGGGGFLRYPGPQGPSTVGRSKSLLARLALLRRMAHPAPFAEA